MNLDKAVCQKWTRYLALKSKFYKAQAYCYFGQDLLDHDKCGEAIKCLQESATRKCKLAILYYRSAWYRRP